MVIWWLILHKKVIRSSLASGLTFIPISFKSSTYFFETFCLPKDKGEQTIMDSKRIYLYIGNCAFFSKDLLPGLKWASTKARMELLGARFRTRTLIKSLCTSDFLNNSLSWGRERRRESRRRERTERRDDKWGWKWALRYHSSESKTVLYLQGRKKLGCREETYRVWVHKLTFNCSRGNNYRDMFSGGAKINVVQPWHVLLIGFTSDAPTACKL